MQREWQPDELVGSWTLVGEDWRLVGNKTGPTRLVFALLPKLFEIEARFPRYAEEISPQAVDYVAEQVGVPAAEFGRYSWGHGRSSTTGHRSGGAPEFVAGQAPTPSTRVSGPAMVDALQRASAARNARSSSPADCATVTCSARPPPR